MKLACQEHIHPGEGILEKWEFEASAGFDGIELRGTEDWLERLDELRSAKEQGVVFSSVCLISDRFIGDLDAGRRREAVEHMKHLLSGIAELGSRRTTSARPSTGQRGISPTSTSPTATVSNRERVTRTSSGPSGRCATSVSTATWRWSAASGATRGRSSPRSSGTCGRGRGRRGRV